MILAETTAPRSRAEAQEGHVDIGTVIRVSGQVDPEELRAIAARLLPSWLWPYVLMVTEELPRLPGGKSDRARASPCSRRRRPHRIAKRAASMSDEHLLERVQAVVVEVAGVHRRPGVVGPDTPLGPGGFRLDSVRLLELILACETKFGMEFEPESDLTADNLRTTGTLTALVQRKRSG